MPPSSKSNTSTDDDNILNLTESQPLGNGHNFYLAPTVDRSVDFDYLSNFTWEHVEARKINDNTGVGLFAKKTIPKFSILPLFGVFLPNVRILSKESEQAYADFHQFYALRYDGKLKSEMSDAFPQLSKAGRLALLSAPYPKQKKFKNIPMNGLAAWIVINEAKKNRDVNVLFQAAHVITIKEIKADEQLLTHYGSGLEVQRELKGYKVNKPKLTTEGRWSQIKRDNNKLTKDEKAELAYMQFQVNLRYDGQRISKTYKWDDHKENVKEVVKHFEENLGRVYLPTFLCDPTNNPKYYVPNKHFHELSSARQKAVLEICNYKRDPSVMIESSSDGDDDDDDDDDGDDARNWGSDEDSDQEEKQNKKRKRDDGDDDDSYAVPSVHPDDPDNLSRSSSAATIPLTPRYTPSSSPSREYDTKHNDDRQTPAAQTSNDGDGDGAGDDGDGDGVGGDGDETEEMEDGDRENEGEGDEGEEDEGEENAGQAGISADGCVFTEIHEGFAHKKTMYQVPEKALTDLDEITAAELPEGCAREHDALVDHIMATVYNRGRHPSIAGAMYRGLMSWRCRAFKRKGRGQRCNQFTRERFPFCDTHGRHQGMKFSKQQNIIDDDGATLIHCRVQADKDYQEGEIIGILDSVFNFSVTQKRNGVVTSPEMGSADRLEAYANTSESIIWANQGGSSDRRAQENVNYWNRLCYLNQYQYTSTVVRDVDTEGKTSIKIDATTPNTSLVTRYLFIPPHTDVHFPPNVKGDLKVITNQVLIGTKTTTLKRPVLVLTATKDIDEGEYLYAGPADYDLINPEED